MTLLAGHQKFLWQNSTQVAFGTGCVVKHMKRWVSPGSRVLCVSGGGSIERNGCKIDVETALNALACVYRWEGGIPPNPEYERCIEIIEVAKSFRPDLILAVGGGSVIDASKYISCALGADPGVDMWEVMRRTQEFKGTTIPLGVILTLPATGSEWNAGFVVSRRATLEKFGLALSPMTFPKFSLIDPAYTMTLPARQLRNGVFDALTHVTDNLFTGEIHPFSDRCRCETIKELIAIGPDVIKDGAPIELRERLIVAASFALNGFFQMSKAGCSAIHQLGHALTALYGIDHGATLSICSKPWWDLVFEERKATFAEAAELVFGIRSGSLDEKARATINKIQEFIVAIGLPTKVSEYREAKIEIQEGDVDKLVDLVMRSARGGVLGWNGSLTAERTKAVFTQIVC